METLGPRLQCCTPHCFSTSLPQFRFLSFFHLIFRIFLRHSAVQRIKEGSSRATINHLSFQKIFPIPAESQPLNWRSYVVSTFWILGSIFWIMNGWATYLKVVNWLIDGGSRTCQRRIRFPEGVKNLNLCTAECWSWSSSRWAAFQSSQSFRAAALKFENAPQREFEENLFWWIRVTRVNSEEGEFWRGWFQRGGMCQILVLQ